MPLLAFSNTHGAHICIMHVKSHLGLQAEGQGRGQRVVMGVGYAWYKLLLLHGTGQMLLHQAAQHSHSSPSLILHI